MQVFFPLLSLSSCTSILFVFFLSSVLCLLNSSFLSLSCFLLTVLARWDFSFPHDIKFFCCTSTEVQSGRGYSLTIRFLPYHLCLGHLFQANSMIDSFAFWCIQASIWWGVLAHSNDHRFSQGVPWKHYPSDVACLDLHHLFLNLHHELIGQYLCLSWFGIFRQRYKPAFISSCIFPTALSLSLVKAIFLFTLLRTAFP